MERCRRSSGWRVPSIKRARYGRWCLRVRCGLMEHRGLKLAAGNSRLREQNGWLPGRNASSERQLCNRIGMNARTVDQRELGSLFTEGQREVGTPKHDRLRAMLLDQTTAHGIEDRTL